MEYKPHTNGKTPWQYHVLCINIYKFSFNYENLQGKDMVCKGYKLCRVKNTEARNYVTKYIYFMRSKELWNE